MKVIEVKSLPGYKLFLSFDDGVNGIIDLSDLVQKGIFKVLQTENNFNKVYVSAYSIAWSEELEIDLLTAYAELANKTPKEVMHSNSQYATD